MLQMRLSISLLLVCVLALMPLCSAQSSSESSSSSSSSSAVSSSAESSSSSSSSSFESSSSSSSSIVASSSSSSSSLESSSSSSSSLAVYGGPSDLILDVGNDTSYPWEWNKNDTYQGAERTPDLSVKINQIIAGGCQCPGCLIDGPYCSIPFRIYSSFSENMEISDIDVNYERVSVISNVTYGTSFKLSHGCEWRIRHQGGILTVRIPAYYSGSATCSYTPTSLHPLRTNDASIDAIYRLLNQTLDKNQDSIIDITLDPNTMEFRTHDMIGIQSLWGPAIIKVIVWV